MYREIVGYRNFHPDTNFNFQLNRWLPFLSEEEVRQAATEISDFDDWSERDRIDLLGDKVLHDFDLSFAVALD